MLSLLVNIGFQILFHSPPGVLFTFPSRYSFAIGHQTYLALEGGPPCFPPDSSCPVVLWVPVSLSSLRLRGFYALRRRFPALFCSQFKSLDRPATPKNRSLSVWALSRSLAATQEIVLTFFSSGYLDVSVRRVPFAYPIDSGMDDGT